MTARRFSGALCGLGLILALAACTPARPPVVTVPPQASPTASPTARPSVTPAAVASVTPAALPSSVPSTPDPDQLPAGWTRETNDQLSVAIPPNWRAIELSGQTAQAALEALKQNDARLAGIVGSPEALQSAAFWAFGPEPEPGGQQEDFVDNINIRRTPLGAQRLTDMQQVIDVLLPEYEKMGLQVTSTDPTLRVNDLPAAQVTYTLSMNAAGEKTFEVRGRQIIVATDTDLWVLSFSTTPEREGSMAAEFETIARSFEPAF